MPPGIHRTGTGKYAHEPEFVRKPEEVFTLLERSCRKDPEYEN